MKYLSKTIERIWLETLQDARLDGLLFEINISDLEIEDWRAFFRFVQSQSEIQYYEVGSEQNGLPDIENMFAHLSKMPLLKIKVQEVELECLIIDEKAMDLTFEPYELSVEQIEYLFEYMISISHQINKTVYLKCEGAEEPFILILPSGVINSKS